jgi:hypothetical protein
VDPLANQEGQESWTPYHFVSGNPVGANDPNGTCEGCDEMANTIASVVVTTVKDLAVSVFNTAVLLGNPTMATTGLLTGEGPGAYRASLDANGDFTVAKRAAPTSVGQLVGHVASDTLDVANTGLTFGTGGTGGVAKTGAVILAKTGAKTVAVNQVAQTAKKVVAKTHGHHSDPKFLGGNPNQKLTRMKTPTTNNCTKTSTNNWTPR